MSSSRIQHQSATLGCLVFVTCTQKLPRKPLALCRWLTSAKVGGKRTDKKKKVPSIPFWWIGGISFVFLVDSLGDSYQ